MLLVDDGALGVLKLMKIDKELSIPVAILNSRVRLEVLSRCSYAEDRQFTIDVQVRQRKVSTNIVYFRWYVCEGQAQIAT